MNDVLVVGGVFRETLLSTDGPQRRLAGPGLVAAQAAALEGASVALAAFVGEDDLQLTGDICAASSVQLVPVAVTPGPSSSFVFDEFAGSTAAWPLLRPACMPAVALSETTDISARVALVFGSPGWDPWADASVQTVVERAGTLLWDWQGFMTATEGSTAAASAACPVRVQLCKVDEVASQVGCDESEVLRRLPTEGFHAAVVKDSCWGVTVLSDGQQASIGAHPVQALDSIGSGDVFGGTVAARIAAGDTLRDAAQAGAAVAARLIATARQPSVAATLRGAPATDALPEPVWVPPDFVRGLRVCASRVEGPAAAALFELVAASARAIAIEINPESKAERPDVRIALAGEQFHDGVPTLAIADLDRGRLCFELAQTVRSLWASKA